MKRILVTGGAGFIASHVSEAFIKAGHKVAILDNLSSGKMENVPKDAEFFKVDITDSEGVEKVFSAFKPEVVDHHAAQISVTRSVREPKYDAEQNILGSINILDTAIRYETRRFIFASTGGALYGDADVIPSDERTAVLPLAPYGIAKSTVENYIRFFKNTHGLEAVILRYANVYGPRQDPHGEAGVVSIFTLKALCNEECLIYGSGNQTRDFVYVNDIADANLKAVDGKEGTYNIGTKREITINELFQEFRKINPKLTVVHLKERRGEVLRSVLNADRASTELGWVAKTSLAEGIRQTYEWFKGKVK
ncbi:NAD-dependent epimerase/dehydratase family protein [bacterium]|nr:NAD-dependent epimerase/dehydratase family protein [bacterium]